MEKKLISVLENKELEHLGLSERHLDDSSIEIARYLLINGVTSIHYYQYGFSKVLMKFCRKSYCCM